MGFRMGGETPALRLFPTPDSRIPILGYRSVLSFSSILRLPRDMA